MTVVKPDEIFEHEQINGTCENYFKRINTIFCQNKKKNINSNPKKLAAG